MRKNIIISIFLFIAFICMSSIKLADIYTETQIKRFAKLLSKPVSQHYPSMDVSTLLRANFQIQTTREKKDKDIKFLYNLPFSPDCNGYDKYKNIWVRQTLSNPELIHLALKEYGNIFFKTYLFESLNYASFEEINKRLVYCNWLIYEHEKLFRNLLNLDDITLHNYIRSLNYDNDFSHEFSQWQQNLFASDEKYSKDEILDMLYWVNRANSTYQISIRNLLSEFLKGLQELKQIFPKEFTIKENKNGEMILIYTQSDGMVIK